VQISIAVNATVIGVADAPRGHQDFDCGAAKKFVLDSHGVVAACSGQQAPLVDEAELQLSGATRSARPPACFR